jgi:hypothetical protein
MDGSPAWWIAAFCMNTDGRGTATGSAGDRAPRREVRGEERELDRPAMCYSRVPLRSTASGHRGRDATQTAYDGMRCSSVER